MIFIFRKIPHWYTFEWKEYIYKMVQKRRYTWSEADTVCRKEGGHLWSITDAVEMAAVLRWLECLSAEWNWSSAPLIYIGLHREQVTNV